MQLEEPFVPFIGAGASALPPSSLPTWFGFNDMLLKRLAAKLAEYSGDRQPTAEILARFQARRNETPFFAPDFQAQLIEEEMGAEYFGVWQSIDTTTFGPVHAGIAELAAQGKVAAIVTVNFDRLIESALAAYRVPFNVFADRAGFDRISGDSDALAVIKIHGTIEDPTSLIDTLKQRLVGRPPSLMNALRNLLQQHPWLFLGFSGADFAYDPNYLGILEAAPKAKGFLFINRIGTEPLAAVKTLVEAYGHEKAATEAGDLALWLQRRFLLQPWSQCSDRSLDVNSKIGEWVDRLEPIAVVNTFCAMLKSTGMGDDAFWLLRKTWKSYRTPVDIKGRSYARFNLNYGLALLEAGLIHNPMPLADDLSNVSVWREHADQNAFDYLARAYKEELLSAGGHLATLLALRGELGEAIALAAEVLDRALTEADSFTQCDVAVATAPVYDFIPCVDATPTLSHYLDLAKELGDEPRRAALAVNLSRALTYLGRFEEADDKLAIAERIAERLDLHSLQLGARGARARLVADSGKDDAWALDALQKLVQSLQSIDDIPLFTKIDVTRSDQRAVDVKRRSPALSRALLDLNRAAHYKGDGQTIHETLAALDPLVNDVFPGYKPHYYLAWAESLIDYGSSEDQPRAQDLIAAARNSGTENPCIEHKADKLSKRIAQRYGDPTAVQ